MILAATLLWSVEVILVEAAPRRARHRARSPRRAWALGTVVLVGWLAVSGPGRAISLRSAPSSGAGRSLTGLLLTAYVATWYAALARAQAVDVTAVLVFGAVVTALIAGVADGAVVDPVGTALITAGAVLVALVAVRRPSAGSRRRDRRARSCSRGTRTRRTRSATAAPTRPARCSSTATPARPTPVSPSSRERSRARGRTSR